MARSATSSSEVLTLRVPRELARRLAREARRQRRTRGEVARDILTSGLGGAVDDPGAEARRQSILVRDRESEREAIRFVTDAADLKGWQ
jgi:predicted transcriptional regulator